LTLAATAAVLAGLSAPAGAQQHINYAKVFKRASPAVVVVAAIQGNTVSRGTGSIIDKSGLVLTNTHVVTDEGKDIPLIMIYLKPARLTGNASKDLHLRYRARLVAKHEAYDIALLQILRPPKDLPALPLSDLSSVNIGEPTAAIGHPGGGAMWSLTTGKISAAYEDYKGVEGYHVFQTETAINPGNSGGPLLDGSGSIIGVNTFIVRVNNAGIPLVGLSFAVKSTTVRTWVTEVMGELPSVSEIAKAPEPIKPLPVPPVAKVQEAKPNVPKKAEVTPKKEKKAAQTQWVVKAKRKGKRTFAAPPIYPRSADGYLSKYPAGRTFLGSKLQGKLKKIRKGHRKTQNKLDRLMEQED